MYFRVYLKMKKPTLCCCFSWIVFIELNFTVAFLLIRKTWDDGFVVEVGGWGILRNRGDPSNGRMILKWGFDTPLRIMKLFWINVFSLSPVYVFKKRQFCVAGKPSAFPKLEIGKKRQKYFSECRKKEVKINSVCYFLVFILYICIVLILLKYINIYLVLI